MNTCRPHTSLIGALALASLLAGAASASTITRSLTLQVYQVCDNSGNNCASTGPAGDAYFAAETGLIWSQAGIGVNFNFAGQILNSSFLNIDASEGAFQALTGGASTTTVDVFLIDTIAGAYGEGWFEGGGLAIAMQSVMAYNSGSGRIDTIAHELGHNLGLVPTSLGGDSGGHSSNPLYLMASGGARAIPTTSADISPSGLGYDQIPQDQIALALQSSLLQDVAPEPVSVVLAGCGLLVLVTIRRGRRE